MTEEQKNEWAAMEDRLMPVSGKAETVAGEIIRAVDRIWYRWYNDGDKINVGYGKETCNGTARFLEKIRGSEFPAEVWNGCAVMTDYSVGRCGFVFSGEIDGVPVLSDESWRVRLLPGWKSVCEFDAAVPPGEWETPAVLDEIPWNPADPCLPPLSEEAVLPETIRRDEFAGENVIRASFERIFSTRRSLASRSSSRRACCDCPTAAGMEASSRNATRVAILSRFPIVNVLSVLRRALRLASRTRQGYPLPSMP